MNNLKHTIEAIIFASGNSISYNEILEYIPYIQLDELKSIINDLKKDYGGERGIHLLLFNDKVQFSTNPEYGEIIAEVLTPLKERSLSRSLMEVLAIIAYKEPVTRLDIEEIRGVNCDYPLSMLLKMNLIANIGRKDTVGRPSLYATTDEFLKKFELQSINDLPDYEVMLDRIKLIEEDYNERSESLYRNVNIDDDNMEEDSINMEDAM